MNKYYIREQEEDVEEQDASPQFVISSKKNTVASHVIQLGRNIGSDPAEYFELVQFLYNVPEKDTVTLLLGGFGGDTDVGAQLVHAMKNCPAPLTVVVHSNCYSMHAILAVCGDALMMQPKTFLMFHNYSCRTSGKGGELVQGVAESARNSIEFDQEFLAPFLTKAELRKISNDQDVYVHQSDSDLKKRIERHFK